MVHVFRKKELGRRKKEDYDISFQAYIDNITEKTGKTPEQIRDEVVSQGVLEEDMKATVFTDWLKKESGQLFGKI